MSEFRKFIKKIWMNCSPEYRKLCFVQDDVRQIKEAIGPLHTIIDRVNHDVQMVSQQVGQMQGELNEYLRPQQERFSGHYEYWRAKRVTAIVEYYGEDWFKGKKILELGCGYGDIGYVFMSLGAHVTFAEGRAENVDYLRRRFPNNPVYQMNCENEWPFPEDAHFDLVLHMGLLYHLNDIWFSLDHALNCTNNLVLETEVSDSDDEDYILKIEENKDGYDQSMSGHGSRPAAEYLEKHLQEQGWSFQRVQDGRCNAQFHVYDWKVENTGTWRDGLRRFWFCERKVK